MKRQFFDLKVGETLAIGGSTITLEAKSGQRARLRVESDAPTQRVGHEPVRPPEPTQPPGPLLSRPKPE